MGLCFFILGGSNGYRFNYSQLEQGLAALVLVVLAAHLADKLLDRPAACAPVGFSHRIKSAH
jgi:hypothetical protein